MRLKSVLTKSRFVGQPPSTNFISSIILSLLIINIPSKPVQFWKFFLQTRNILEQKNFKSQVLLRQRKHRRAINWKSSNHSHLSLTQNTCHHVASKEIPLTEEKQTTSLRQSHNYHLNFIISNNSMNFINCARAHSVRVKWAVAHAASVIWSHLKELPSPRQTDSLYFKLPICIPYICICMVDDDFDTDKADATLDSHFVNYCYFLI